MRGGSGALAQDRPDPAARRRTDLHTRAVSAAILAPLAIGAIWAGGAVWAAAILALAAGIACEWVQLCGQRVLGPGGLAVPGVVLLAGVVALTGHERLGLLVLLVGFAAAGWAGGAPGRSAGGAASLAAGVPYVGLACIALLWLRGDGAAGRPNVLFLMLVVWASDVGAYAAGRLIGGPRLAPRISPKKTWSGAAGGLLAAIAMGEAVAFLTAGASMPGRVAAIALLLGVVSQAGDLFESLMKRRFGVKELGPADPGPWRPSRPARRGAGRRPGYGPAGAHGRERSSPLAMTKTITVLGSTGSVGTQTMELLAGEPGRFRIRALVAGRNATLLAEQARALGAELAVISDPASGRALEAALRGSGITVGVGDDAVVEAAGLPADWTMAAITGAAGLAPTLAAIRGGGAVALANKEALVCAGEVMLRAVREAGATLLPVDSEHNAIFQALADGNRAAVEQIVLTASGGPFRTASLDDMARATPEAALRHPVWSMGAKISIDSATMMNKGLELIEAARLFGLDEPRIGVLVHPQSVVHGLVYYEDGSVLAQLGSPDMRVPIGHTLAWPERMRTPARRLDLAALGRLEFTSPDPVRFPALGLARDALRAGQGLPTLLSAANEVAVAAFLARRIGFLDIAATVEKVMNAMGVRTAELLEEVVALDGEARRKAEECVGAAQAA